LIGERERVRLSADGAGLFVAGFESGVGVRPPLRSKSAGHGALRALGSRQPGEPDSADAKRAHGALSALAPFCASKGIVIVRRHVLGVETGEGLEALLARTAGLRQWGDRGRSRRGVLVLGAVAALSDQIVASAGRMGLAGVVSAGAVGAGTVRAIACADELEMFIASVDGSGEHGE